MNNQFHTALTRRDQSECSFISIYSLWLALHSQIYATSYSVANAALFPDPFHDPSHYGRAILRIRTTCLDVLDLCCAIPLNVRRIVVIIKNLFREDAINLGMSLNRENGVGCGHQCFIVLGELDEPRGRCSHLSDMELRSQLVQDVNFSSPKRGDARLTYDPFFAKPGKNLQPSSVKLIFTTPACA